MTEVVKETKKFKDLTPVGIVAFSMDLGLRTVLDYIHKNEKTILDKLMLDGFSVTQYKVNKFEYSGKVTEIEPGNKAYFFVRLHLDVETNEDVNKINSVSALSSIYNDITKLKVTLPVQYRDRSGITVDIEEEVMRLTRVRKFPPITIEYQSVEKKPNGKTRIILIARMLFGSVIID